MCMRESLRARVCALAGACAHGAAHVHVWARMSVRLRDSVRACVYYFKMYMYDAEEVCHGETRPPEKPNRTAVNSGPTVCNRPGNTLYHEQYLNNESAKRPD